MAKFVRQGDPVTRGEVKTLDYLRDHLPGDWVVIGNLQVTRGDLNREIDAVVIGDSYVWVIDEKGFWGRITGNAFSWILSDGSARERVLGQIEHTAKVLKGRLTAIDKKLDAIWVQPLVLLSADDVVLEVDDPRIPKLVQRLNGCEEYFRQPNLPKSKLAISPALRDQMVKALCGSHVVDRLHSRLSAMVGRYRIVEKVSESGILRTYRAERARAKDQVELKVYDLSGLTGAQRNEARKQAEREFESLRMLRDTHGVIRIAESYQPVPGYDEMSYFALDLPWGPALSAKINDDTWSLPSRVAAAKRLCEVVRDVHIAKVVHRNLTPACVHFWRNDQDFQVSGFEFSKLPASTVNLPQDEFDFGPYSAPEVRESLHNADAASDVFSLGVILFEMISGQLPSSGGGEDEKGISLPEIQGLKREGSRAVERLLRAMTDPERQKRPESLDGAIEVLSKLQPSLGAVDGRSTHPLPADATLGQFTVLAYLGSGGSFHVYKVARNSDDSKEYVAKVVRSPELLATARQEFAALNNIEHRNIASAEEVSLRPEAPYHLLEPYIPGEMVSELVSRGRSSSRLVARWALELSDALAYLESRNPRVTHRDISARNVIIDKDRPVLIDFGLSLFGAAKQHGVVGTAPYRPPECDRAGVEWPKNGDIYSLAIVLCELLFGGLPYSTAGGTFQKQKILADLFQGNGSASDQLLAILRRAIDSDPGKRFPCAADFQAAIRDVPELRDAVLAVRDQRVINAHVAELLRLYNRGTCNADNRGMDSDFARLTYIPTDLDRRLVPDILAHKYALVVLAGNPGDGKTAFLQQLALKLGWTAALPLHHWLIEKDDWTYECVLDGSAADSERGLDSDAVLDAVLQPFEDLDVKAKLASKAKRTQLVAINDGRFLEYLDERSHSERSSWIVTQLLAHWGEHESDLHPEIVVVDLNRRALVSGVPGSEDVFSLSLGTLLNGGDSGKAVDPWGVCERCRAFSSCHIRFNVESLREPVIGKNIRERLQAVLTAIHGRGRLHLTMRELRSWMAFAFFGAEDCEAIHRRLEDVGELKEDEPIETTDPSEALYFNRLFGTGAEGGRLFGELADFDPGKVNNPRLDRALAGASSPRATYREVFARPSKRSEHDELSRLLTADADHESDGTVESAKSDSKRNLVMLRRRLFFFEGRPEVWDDKQNEEYWLEMTPFRSIKRWTEELPAFTAKHYVLRDDLAQTLCRAISRTENVPEDLLDRFLAVRTTADARVPLVIVRLFPLADFKLSWEHKDAPTLALNELPTSMTLSHERGEPRLEISADLFELLMRFAEGYRLGSEELESIAASLRLFKNRLLAIPAKEISLLHPLLGSFTARQELRDGKRKFVLQDLR